MNDFAGVVREPPSVPTDSIVGRAELEELRQRVAYLEASAGVRQTQHHGQTERRFAALSAIYQTSQQLQRLQAPEALAQQIIYALDERLAYEHAAVLLLDASTGTLVPLALSRREGGSASKGVGPGSEADYVPPRGLGITYWVAKHGETVRLGDVERDPRYYRGRDDIRSELCVPLRIGDQVFGVVNVESAETDAYSEEDQWILETVAAQIAVAIQNTRLYEQVRRHAEDLEGRVARRAAQLRAANARLRQEITDRSRAESEIEHRLREITLLQRVSSLIAQAPGLGEALRDVCEELARFLHVPQAGFAILNEAGTAAEVIADYHPPSTASALGASIPVAGNPSMAYILEHQAPLVVGAAQSDPILSAVREIMEQRCVQSILLVPVMAGGRVIGTLGFDAFRPHVFIQAEVDLVQNVANQMGQALLRKRAEEVAQRRARELDALQRTVLEITEQNDLPALLQTITERAANLLDAPCGSLYLCEPKEGLVRCVVSYHTPRDYCGILLKYGEGAAGTVAQTGQPLIIDDYGIWPNRAAAFEEDQPFRAVLAVPLTWHGRVIGVIDVSDQQPGRRFLYNDLELLQLFANHAAIAVENTRLFAAERLAREQTQALREAAHSMSESLDIDHILRRILEQLRRVLAYDTASVLVFQEGGEPHLLAGVGYANEAFTSREATRLFGGSPILRKMLVDPKPVVHADVRQVPGWIWVPGAEHVRSWMAIPLVAHGRTIGALMVDHSTPGFYSEPDLHVAQILAQHAAQALENARLFQDRVRAEREAQERRLYLEALLTAHPDAVVTLDAQHRLVEWNAGAERLFGYTKDEVIGQNIDDLVIPPDRLAEAAGITAHAMSGKEVSPIETIRCRKDGTPVEVRLAGSPILLDGELQGIVGVYTDISARKQAERALRKANRGLHLLSRANEVLSRARDEAEFLQAICQIAVEVGGYRLAWVGFAEQNEAEAVRPAAQAGVEEGYLETLRLTWTDEERGRGPAGTAIRTGRPVVARDIRGEPTFAPWREEAMRRGYASSIALPLRAEWGTLGALTIYASEADAFDKEEIALLSELADNLAHGVLALRSRQERLQAEEALRRYAMRLETLHQIHRAIVEAQSAEAIAQATLARIERLVPCRQARIVGFDNSTQGFVVLAVHPSAVTPAQVIQAAQCPSCGTSDGAAAPVEVDVPLVAEGELIGVLHLESDIDYDQEQIQIIYELAAPLALSIQHARLQEQLQQRAGVLEEIVAQRTRELQAEHDRTQAILESLGEAVIVSDVDGTVLYVNPAATMLTGRDIEEVVGQKWQALQTEAAVAMRNMPQPASASEPHQPSSGAPCRPESTWRGEIVSRRADGSTCDLAVTVTPLFASDAGGGIVGSVWVERDITPLKEAERLKDQFVSNVSHELRTPLSILTLVAGNLDRQYHRLDDMQRRAMIRSVREQVQLLNDLVGDILEMSRIDSGRISKERVRLDLTALVHEEVEKQRPLAGRKSQQLAVTGADALWVRGNDGQLRQVVRNLLNNAIKFTPTGGQITCRCGVEVGGGGLGLQWPDGAGLAPGRWAALYVVDTGIGIDEGEVAHLFERFYRAKTEGNIPGTGLGLAIVRELTHLHGGHVALASTPGEGSTFAVFLPLEEE